MEKKMSEHCPRLCNECGCNHAQVITSIQECSCECHYGDLLE